MRRQNDLWSRAAQYLGDFDFLQIVPAALLTTVSLLFVWSTGQQVGTVQSEGFFLKQLLWIAIGGGGWLFAANFDYRKLNGYGWLFYICCIVLLIAVPLVGVKVYGARRWLDFRLIGLRVQPSEFMKLALTLVLSSTLARFGKEINRFGVLTGAVLLTALPFALIVIEPDLGGATILLPILLVLLFCGGLSRKLMIAGGCMVVLLATLAIVNESAGIRPLLKSYQKQRIVAFLNPESDQAHSNYNQLQSVLAVGSGSWNGKGLGQGTQNTLGFLPQTVSNNDFIFSVIAEEWGFRGGVLILGCYFLLFFSIIRTAARSPDLFGTLICAGVATMLFVNVFVNIGMSMGVTPVTGLTLPLVSYGGSSMLLVLTSLGIVQSIYRRSREEAR